MRTLIILLAALFVLPGGSAFAQEQETEFDALRKEFDKVWREWRKKDIAARRSGDDEETRKKIKAEEPAKDYLPRFKAGAERHVGTEAAVPYLMWLVSWGARLGTDDGVRALDAIVKDHVASPQMGRLVFSVALRARREGFDRAKTLAAQKLIAEKGATQDIRADAHYWRAYVIAGTKSTGAEKKEALADLDRAIALGNKRRKSEAEGLRFEMTRLQIGMVAPDIKGYDLDSTPFKLSDYRGKVILLDFWGDW